MRRVFLGSALIALAACGRVENQNTTSVVANEQAETVPTAAPRQNPSTPAQDSLPSSADAARAVQAIVNTFELPTLQFGRVGAPSECVAGDMAGQLVQLCHLRMKAIFFRPRVGNLSDIMVNCLDVSVPFKRAISYDQPDIAPAERDGGVWVVTLPNPMVTGRPATLSYTSVQAKSLTPADVEPLGIYTREENGEIQVGTRPLGGHSPGLRYIHIPEPANAFAGIFQSRIPPSISSALDQCEV
jgi:hypothetical protein